MLPSYWMADATQAAMIDTDESRNIHRTISKFPAPLRKVAAVLKKYGFDVRVVGGAVRDFIIGKPARDIDFATDADPSELIYIFNLENIPHDDKGIGHGTFVVLYSHATPTWATRIWWMLRAVGFDDAAILDGGLDKWKAEGRPLETKETIHPPATLTLRGRPEIFVDKNDIKAAIGKAGTLTLNALSQDQHKGSGGVIYGRAGRIAGSSCVPAASLFGPDKTLKPINELRAAFDDVGAAPDKRVLVYCGGGIAATLDAFVLTALLGHKNVSVYDNSMQEWSNDPSLPMEVG